MVNGNNAEKAKINDKSLVLAGPTVPYETGSLTAEDVHKGYAVGRETTHHTRKVISVSAIIGPSAQIRFCCDDTSCRKVQTVLLKTGLIRSEVLRNLGGNICFGGEQG